MISWLNDLRNSQRVEHKSVRAQELKSIRRTPPCGNPLVHLCLVLLCLGCEQRRKEEVLAIEPNVAPIVFMADYASDAIQATGGTDVWTKIDMLALVGVVTVYQPDGSLYLTEHHFEIYPWLNSIKISAQEPLSRFVWQLSGEQFSLLEGDKQLDVEPPCLLSKTETGVTYRDYAEAVLNLVTAPVRFLDDSVVFVKEPGPVRMEGRWYYSIVQTYPAPRPSSIVHPWPPAGELPSSDEGRGTRDEGRAVAQASWSQVVFFQNRDSPASGGQGSLVDMVWFADIEQKKFLAVRGYDYKEVHPVRENSDGPNFTQRLFSNGVKDGVLVPTKIEIFTTDARAVTAKRLVKIDFLVARDSTLGLRVTGHE